MKQGIYSPERVKRHLVRRVLTYVAGLFLISIAINLFVYADLGNSAATTVGVVYSARFDLPLGTCSLIMYTGMVVGQLILFGRAFQWINLWQVPFAIFYGKSVDLVAAYMPVITPSNLIAQCLLLVAGLVIIAVGILMFVGTELVPMPLEGLALAISMKTHLQFHQSKILIDCTCAGVALISSILFFGELVGVGIATVFLAISTGWMMGKIKPYLPRWIQNWHLS
ncbi:DUF6198 family protein [Bengtsoniella intestinalis]|uniref:YczE/YyaS/YitT family protein n=1 Tax=Bengtsoniella intestinalis TaxID=3073143 RepID=UPI00391F8D0A